MTALAAHDLAVEFGGIRAVDGVTFELEEGAITAMIGPNGAGKTTLFNLLSGLYQPTRGRVRLFGDDVTGTLPHRLAALGLSRTFQNLEVFFRMSAEENVMVGHHLAERRSVWRHLLPLPPMLGDERQARQDARVALARVGLGDVGGGPAADLPYGALKRLEIARALAAKPRILLLDEPAAGCNDAETEALSALIDQLARDGITILLVEHDMTMVMSVSRRVIVLSEGRIIADGAPQEIRSDPAVHEAYLGSPA
ncbi:MAG: ABC transporter ATP-binding protein [Pseudomonadota bacterium]